MPIALEGVTFAYPDGPTVLEDATVRMETGSYTLVRGPSGSGKSTLLRLLCRLEEPQAGQILFHGEPVDTIAPATLRRSVAYVQQMPTLLPGTIRENLLLPFSFKANEGLERPNDETLNQGLAALLLHDLSLDNKGNSLSVGQSQRICLLRSLLLSPEVLLLDEPTASLDSDSAQVVLDKAAELNRQGMTVIMISHSKEVPHGVTHIIRIGNGSLEYA